MLLGPLNEECVIRIKTFVYIIIIQLMLDAV